MLRIKDYVINLKEIIYLSFNKVNKELKVCFINGTILIIEKINKRMYDEICIDLFGRNYWEDL